jgi:4-alpha-glucanotransferase
MLLQVAFSCASLFSIHMLQDYIISGSLGENRNGYPGILKDPLKHRINIPGTPEDKNWGYVFPFLAEELLSEKELSKKIKELIAKSGRIP